MWTILLTSSQPTKKNLPGGGNNPQSSFNCPLPWLSSSSSCTQWSQSVFSVHWCQLGHHASTSYWPAWQALLASPPRKQRGSLRTRVTDLPATLCDGRKKNKQSKKFIIVSLLAFLPKSYLAVFVKQEKEISPHAKSPVGSIETVLARWKGLRCLRLFGQPNGHLIYLRRWSRMSRLLFTNGSSARQAARLPDCLTSVCAHTRTCPVEHFGVIWWQHWARSQHVFIDWFLLPLWWCAILLQCPNRTLLHFGWPSCLGTCWGHQLLSWWLLAKK